MGTIELEKLKRELMARVRVPGGELTRILAEYPATRISTARDVVIGELAKGTVVGYVPAVFYRALELDWQVGRTA